MLEPHHQEAMPELKTDSSGANKKPRARDLSEIIKRHLESLSERHRAVLENGEVEAIHKMRVTTRRLQAALDLLQTKEDELRVRKLKKRLRRWRRVLSRVRNYDVFLLLIEKESAGRSLASRNRFEHLKSVIENRRAQKAAKAKRYLAGVHVNDIATRLGMTVAEPQPGAAAIAPNAEIASDETAFIESGQPVAEPPSEQTGEQTTGPEPIKPQLKDEKAIARRAVERLEQRLAEFHERAAQAHPTTDPSELHELRIAAKRLRYLLEIISEMGYGSATRSLAWLKSLQDRIGDWHDVEALETEIVAIVSRPKFIKKHIAESSALLQAAEHLRKKKESLMTKLFPLKAPATLTTTSQRLAKALRRRAISD